MNKNNNEEKKCRMCGKVLVGKNKLGLCSACKRKTGNVGVAAMGALALIGSTLLTVLLRKK